MEKKLKLLEADVLIFFPKNILNVLHAKECLSNLLSINKITQELNCEIIFSSKNIIFQEKTMKNVIRK
jgi:hypothetical protein